MNKEMTIYELLGLIKDDKIKSGTYIIYYNREHEDKETMYVCLSNILYKLETKEIELNDKVEILEEDKDIELLDVALLSQSDNWLWCPSKDDFEKDIELNAYIISNIRENTLNFQRKLNELIKEVNKLRKDK